MSRKPINETATAAKPQGQDGVWVEIRRRKEFTPLDIHHATEIPKKTISDYAKRLVAGGVLEEVAGDGVSPRYKLIRDMGVHTPRFRKNGEPVTQGMGNQNIWRSMRMMSEFSPRDIAAHSTTDNVQVSEDTVRTYCTMLLRAGYLRVLVKAIPSKRQARYRLIKNTGPLPPKIQRVKQVFDPNLNQVVHTAEAGQ